MKFSVLHKTGSDATYLIQEIVLELSQQDIQPNFAWLYITDLMQPHLEYILEQLKEKTKISHWFGTVGIAIIGNEKEYFDLPAISILFAELPEQAWQFLPPINHIKDINNIHLDPQQQWVSFVHANPNHTMTQDFIEAIPENEQNIFLVGGLTSSRHGDFPQIVEDIKENILSGICFKQSAIPLLVDHTQGCRPISPQYTITQAKDNTIITLDDKPALQVFKAHIGEILARDIKRASGYIFAGLPIPDIDKQDYLIRPIMGIDETHQLLLIGDYMTEGQPFMFCQRDGNTAREDIYLMLDRLIYKLAGRKPKAGIYISCLGRGRYQFGEDDIEVGFIREKLGDFPLVGLFANGEIYHQRLYGYTGVLTLFI